MLSGKLPLTTLSTLLVMVEATVVSWNMPPPLLEAKLNLMREARTMSMSCGKAPMLEIPPPNPLELTAVLLSTEVALSVRCPSLKMPPPLACTLPRSELVLTTTPVRVASDDRKSPPADAEEPLTLFPVTELDVMCTPDAKIPPAEPLSEATTWLFLMELDVIRHASVPLR